MDIVGFCPLFILWDFVLWDFVLWDSVPDLCVLYIGFVLCVCMHVWCACPGFH